ncbi:MAG TPA: isoaspartyl peptidase/L-asparaginase [Herpetosiphonaceae bacterium]
MPISMIVHGGAWAIPDAEVDAHLRGVSAALAAGWHLLSAGASALDACEAAVRAMEDDPTFDAGVGSFLNAVGQVEMDAAVMDGRTLDAGAVAAIGRVRNPVRLARHVMQTEHVLVVGAGAEQLAEAVGIPCCEPLDLVVPRERERWQRIQADPSFAIEDAFRGHDTVGALALDERGNIAAAISTGGVPNKLPGRVGDTPLIGCGLYADDEAGACCATGLGEAIIRVVLSKSVVDRLAHGESAQDAADHAIEMMARRTDGAAGCIVLRPDGSVGVAHNTPRMAYAYRCGADEPVVGVRHGER